MRNRLVCSNGPTRSQHVVVCAHDDDDGPVIGLDLDDPIPIRRRQSVEPTPHRLITTPPHTKQDQDDGWGMHRPAAEPRRPRRWTSSSVSSAPPCSASARPRASAPVRASLLLWNVLYRYMGRRLLCAQQAPNPTTTALLLPRLDRSASSIIQNVPDGPHPRTLAPSIPPPTPRITQHLPPTQRHDRPARPLRRPEPRPAALVALGPACVGGPPRGGAAADGAGRGPRGLLAGAALGWWEGGRLGGDWRIEQSVDCLTHSIGWLVDCSIGRLM